MVVAVAATVVALAAVAQVAAATVVELVVAVAVPAAAVAVTAVAVAATKQLAALSASPLTNKLGSFGTLFVLPMAQFRLSVARGLRGRPANSRSNHGLGSKRNSLATTPICHGITR